MVNHDFESSIANARSYFNFTSNMSACSNQNEVSTAPKRQGGDHVDQSFHLADGIRLTMAPTVNSLFSTADDLFQIHHDNTCRRVSVKFLDENKREIEREENLDLREALETEVVTVLNTFVAEQVRHRFVFSAD